MSDWSSDVCSSDLDSPPLLGIEIGVFAAYRDAQERQDVVYLQSSRQIVDGAELIASFEEGHSHATTHLIQVADLAIEDMVRAARTLVIVDDECSTGNTYVAVANAMMEVMHHLELIDTCCITDWSGGDYIRNMPRQKMPVSIISGYMSWTAGTTPSSEVLASGSNVTGRAPTNGMKSHRGLYQIGRQTCRERGCKYVYIRVVEVYIKTK